MIQVRLLLLGLAIIGSIGLGIYQHYNKNTQEEPRHSYGSRDRSDTSRDVPAAVLSRPSSVRPRLRRRKSNHSVCSICLSEVGSEAGAPAPRSLKSLQCGHGFHRSCIDIWIAQDNKTCPLCRGAAI